MSTLETNKDDKHREIEKVDGYWHKIGYKTGLLATGLLAGLIIGAVLAIRNTKNAIIGKQSEQALASAQTDKMSIRDLDSLSRSEKLADTEHQQIAIFIDRLEQVSGSLEQGRQVGSDYIFTKSIDESGLANYTVTDAKSQQQIVNFDLDKNGKVAVKPIEKIAGSQERLMTFIKSTARKIDLDLAIKDPSVIESEELPAALTTLAQEAAEVQQSLETLKATELTNATTEEKLQRVEELSAQTDRLSALKTQAKRLQNSIHTAENANAKLLERDPSATGRIVKVSLLADKLADVDRTIGIIETSIGEQYQILDNSKSLQTEVAVATEFAAPDYEQLEAFINHEEEPDYEEYEEYEEELAQ
jgi:hypothetical protein